MTPLLKVLLGAHESGLIPMRRLSKAADLLVPSFGRQLLAIRTDRSTTKADMLAEFAESLGLPDWFGHNLDAAHEALHDRLASDANNLVCVHAAPTGADAQAFQQFIDVIDSVLTERGVSGILLTEAIEPSPGAAGPAPQPR